MSTGGAVLTGGRASRFGRDKALALLNGRSLVAHVADRLRPRVVRLVTCGGRARLPGVPHLADQPRPDLGPLGGLCAALLDARREGLEWVLSAGCDTPNLDDRLLDDLLEARAPAYVASLPILGLWPTGCAGDLAEWLETDARHSVRGWAERIGARPVQAEGEIANINTPADLAHLAKQETR